MKQFCAFLILSLSFISELHAQWSLSGNSISAGNFLGTTNAQSLVFMVSSTRAGYLDATNNVNTFFGVNSGGSTSATQCVAIGAGSLYSNTSSATANTAVGWRALYANTSGSSNVGIGTQSLYSNTSGEDNTAMGASALYGCSTGYDNVAIGSSALFDNGSGTYNCAMGVLSMYNTSGTQNVALGYSALAINTTGSNNTAVGTNALYYGNASGNSAVGYNALSQNISGNSNSAVGQYALLGNEFGSYNVALGDSALYDNQSGNNNVAIGVYSGPNASNLSNTSTLGYKATATASNSVVIGNSSVTSIGGYANWTNFSDGRYKKNIQENVPGLAFIKLLMPITYNLDITNINNKLHAGKSSSDDEAAISQKEKILYTGFVAQDVQTAAKKVGYEFSGIATPQNDNDFYGLRYSDFVPPLVKSVQELSSKNDSLQSVIDSLKNSQANLQSQVNSIVQQLSSLKATVLSDAPSLKQNFPNPYNSPTTINYSLPGNTADAQLIITDGQGRVLKDVVLNNAKGPGQAIVDAGELASGIYFYSLVVNGKSIDTKKMILTK